jgi:micrococcal nuclease
MNAIKQFWNGSTFNKIILGVFVPVFGICTCCLGGSALFNLMPAATATSDPGILSTIVVETALASITQTAAVNPLTSTLMFTPTFELSTETPTLIPLLTPTSNIPASASCVPNNTPQTGKVVYITDGDTIKVLLDQDGKTYTIRYIGMDTPENTTQIEYFGPEATIKNSELVSGKNVTLYKDVSETDKYGRLLRYVFVGDIFVNYELVAQGYATAVTYPPDVACADYFRSAQQTASSSGLGLWAVPPTQAILATVPSSADSAPCSCGSNLYNCPDFGTHAKAQACYEYCISVGAGDVHRLDRDNDGSACEDLP